MSQRAKEGLQYDLIVTTVRSRSIIESKLMTLMMMMMRRRRRRRRRRSRRRRRRNSRSGWRSGKGKSRWVKHDDVLQNWYCN